MAILSVVTTAGAALNASGNPWTITRIEVGQGNVTTESAALARTSLVRPFSPPRRTDSPESRVDGAQLQVIYVDDTNAAYDVREVAIFSGTTLVAYVCDDAGAAISTKVAAQSARIGLVTDWQTPVTGTPAAQLQPFSAASEGSLGAVRYATPTEAANRSGTGVVRAQNLPVTAGAASTTSPGLIEAATQAEYDSGSPAGRAVTNHLQILASKLKGLINPARLPGATTSTQGASRLADQAAYNAGTAGRVVTSNLTVPGARTRVASSSERGTMKVIVTTEAAYDRLATKDAEALYIFTS